MDETTSTLKVLDGLVASIREQRNVRETGMTQIGKQRLNASGVGISQSSGKMSFALTSRLAKTLRFPGMNFLFSSTMPQWR
ncbi:MAG: hypothetical protein ACI3Z0_10460 [Candidatus Cryptobacteroides sp.]